MCVTLQWGDVECNLNADKLERKNSAIRAPTSDSSDRLQVAFFGHVHRLVKYAFSHKQPNDSVLDGVVALRFIGWV
jgi:hypothetical protein